MKKTLLILACALSTTAQASWWYDFDSKDEITGERTVKAYFSWPSDNSGLGVRCDVSGSYKKMLLTFDAGTAMDVPRSEIDIFVKVDQNSPVALKGRLYTNSYSAGYVRVDDGTEEVISKLIAQMIAGHTAYVKLENDNYSSIENYTIDLKGFTKHSKKTLSACEFNPKSRAMSQEDELRLAQIDTEIKKLQKEKSEIQSKY